MWKSNGDEQTLDDNGETAIRKRFSGPVTLHLSGNFGGGTFQFKRLSPSGVPVDIPQGLFTEATEYLYENPDDADNFYWGELSGASGPLDPPLRVWIQGQRSNSIPDVDMPVVQSA